MFDKSIILTEAKKAGFKPNLFLLILFIFILFISSYLLPQIVVGNIFDIIDLSDEVMEIINLFLNIIVICAGVFYCLKIEKRSYNSIGFISTNIGKSYTKGIIGALILLTLTVGGCVLFKAVQIEYNNSITPMAVLFFLGYVIQGMSEEVALRGCLMVSATNKTHLPIAIIISSLFFTIPHFFFSDGQFLYSVNVFLMGIFFSLYMLYSGNIWSVSGFHTGFNFFSRCLFNYYPNSNCSIFVVRGNIPGKELIGGNDYGVTSGLMCTICIIIFIILVLCREHSKNSQ